MQKKHDFRPLFCFFSYEAPDAPGKVEQKQAIFLRFSHPGTDFKKSDFFANSYGKIRKKVKKSEKSEKKHVFLAFFWPFLALFSHFFSVFFTRKSRIYTVFFKEIDKLW